jgi:hypothetical protein
MLDIRGVSLAIKGRASFLNSLAFSVLKQKKSIPEGTAVTTLCPDSDLFDACLCGKRKRMLLGISRQDTRQDDRD